MLFTALPCNANSFSPTLAALVAAALLSGCGNLDGFRIHSSEREKQGLAVKESWAKVDLKGQLDVPRQNLAKTLTEQIALEEDIWMSRRSDLAGLMARSLTVEKFQNAAGQELMRVVGGDTPTAALAAASRYQKAGTEVENSTAKLVNPAADIAGTKVPLPPCSIVGDSAKLAAFNGKVDLSKLPTADAKDLYAGALKVQLSHCKALNDARANLLQFQGGALGKALGELQRDQDAYEQSKGDATSLLAALKSAQSEYDAADKALKASGTSDAKKKVDDALDKLRKLTGNLPASASGKDKAPGQLAESAIATKLFSEARLQSINEFLATYDIVVKGDGAPAGSNRLAIGLALFPDLQQKSKEALANVEQPNLVPLILRKNIEQAKLDAATKDVTRLDTIVGLRQQVVTSLQYQMDAYTYAYQVALKQKDQKAGLASFLAIADEATPGSPSAKGGKGGKPVKAAAPGRATDAQIEMWQGATRFLEAEGRLRADVGQNYYRIYALHNEGVLLYAESSIQQWKGLIDPSIELLAQWGEVGLTDKDIVALFNSLMLLAIAIGVN